MKVRNQLLRRGGAVAGIALGLLLAAWSFGAAFKASRGFLSGRLLSFKPATFEVNCPAPEAAGYARELLSKALDSPLTSAKCGALAEELRRRHPGLAYVKVKRNFITGKASVTARPEAVVGPVLLNGATAYLGVSGRFLPEDLSGGSDAGLAAEITGSAGDASGLASFLGEIKPLLPLFYSRPVKLECPARDWACRLRLADGTTVLWGGFEFTRLKILRLNEVVRDAALRKASPFRVDMRYFREGKIFVSSAGPAAR